MFSGRMLRLVQVSWARAHVPRTAYKSVGFALWIGWFGVAYSTTAWVSDDASTVSALGIMFTTSTISHMVGLVAFALAALRFPGFATKATSQK